MQNDFRNIVKAIFEEHGLEDEKLESVVADLFDSFEQHLLSASSVEKLINEIDEVRAVNESIKYF